MKNVSHKEIEIHNTSKNKLINFNKKVGSSSVFKDILISLKNSSKNSSIQNNELSKIEKIIKISDNISLNNKDLMVNFKNLNIKEIVVKQSILKDNVLEDSILKNSILENDILENGNLENSSFFLYLNTTNGSFKIVNSKNNKNSKNINDENTKFKKDVGKVDKIDQKVKILQKNLLSELKISENIEQEKVINEIKEVKNIKDILNVAKKYELNLKDINIKTVNVNEEKNSSSDKLSSKEIKNIEFEKKEKILFQIQQNLNQKFKDSSIKDNSINTKENEKNSDITLNMLLQKNSTIKDNKSKSNKNESKIDLGFRKNDNENNQIVNESLEVKNEKIRENINSEKRVAETKVTLVDNSDKKDVTSNEKIDTTETKKVSGFEEVAKPNEVIKQKIVDAKQTVLSFAKTLQEQIENYKPPFTRMQLSLDPEDLGKVDVTLISRGKNLHIQVNSNPTAIGIMAVQGNELRGQLNSMGFTDVQMQFNMNQQQQQQQNNKRQTYSPNEHIEVDEIPQDYESLEIVLPNYA